MSHDSRPLPPVLGQGLADFVAAATILDIDYALIGGVATGFRSRPRYTRDLDFLLDIPHLKLPGFLDELKRHQFIFESDTVIREWTREHMTALTYQGIQVDWLKPVLPLYRHVLDGARVENWLGSELRIASAEGLIVTKLVSFRLQDQVDIENLLAANREQLDLDWVRQEWQTIGKLDEPPMPQFEEMVSRLYLPVR